MTCRDIALATDHLREAVRDNNANAVKALIQRKANVNAHMFRDATPLWWCFHCGGDSEYDDVIELLLKAKADPNDTGNAPLFGGAPLHKTICPSTAKLLLRHQADVDSMAYFKTTPLIKHICATNPNMVQVLLTHKASTKRLSCGLTAHSPLKMAVKRGNISMTQLLLKAKARPTKEVCEYLICHRDQNVVDCIEVLLQVKTDVGMFVDEPNMRSLANGIAVLHQPIIKLLVEAKVYIQHTDLS
jgi:ankyrin repeat protein